MSVNITGSAKKITDKVTSIVPAGKGKTLLMLGGLALFIIILVVCIVVYRNTRSSKMQNPVYFYPKPHYATATAEQPGSDIHINPAPYTFTWHMFIYVPDWKYRYGFEKEVISKGNGYDACPSIHLGGVENTAIIRMKTSKGIEKLTIPNVPIRRWFHLAVIVQDLRLESYLDGRLVTTRSMTNVIQTNNDTVHFTRHEGFNGYLYRVCYLNKTLPPLTIQRLSRERPPSKQLANLFRKADQ